MAKIENIYLHPNYRSLEDFPGEEWREIPGVPFHMASNLGRLKGVARLGEIHPKRKIPPKIKEKIRRGSTNTRYVTCMLSVGGKKSIVLFHRLVAAAFVPNPDGKPDVNHKNGIKHDNRPENLEWCTRSENAQHAYDTGLSVKAKSSDDVQSIQVAQLDFNGRLVAVWGALIDIARSTGKAAATTQVGCVIRGRREYYLGFHWKRITKEKYIELKARLEVGEKLTEADCV